MVNTCIYYTVRKRKLVHSNTAITGYLSTQFPDTKNALTF